MSIIIPIYNRYDLTRRCLASLRTLTYPRLEILIVDNASQDGSAESIRLEFPGLEVITSATNLGYAGGCNLGIAHSKGRYLFLLNNDTEIVDANLLEVLVSVLEQNPGVAAVGPRIVDYADHDKIVFDGAGDAYGFIDIAGAAFVVRRSALRETGPLDASLFAYYEDRDLFARLLKAGWTLRHVPSVRVAHAVSATSEPGSAFYYYWHNRNFVIYAHRHLSMGRLVFRVLPDWLPATGWFVRKSFVRRDWPVLRAWCRGFVDGMRLALRDPGGVPTLERQHAENPPMDSR